MDERRILEDYPLPLARAYRRCRNAAEPRGRHDAAYFLFEICLKYLSAAAIAHYLAGGERDHRVNAALKGLARPSLGEWLLFLRECLRFLTRDDENTDPAIMAVARLFSSKDSRRRAAAGLFNALRAFRTKEKSEKQQVHLEALFCEIVTYRNRVLGHGAPLTREHYESFAELFSRAFSEVAAESTFLTVRRLVAFDAIRVRAGERVECFVKEYMGEQPDRKQDPLTIPYGEAVPNEGSLYLLDEGRRFVSLEPLLVAHRDDVWILNEAKGAPEYLSYTSGERHRPSELGEDQGALFERILGYRIDETRISQMGEEVALSARQVDEALGGGERRLGDYRIVREVGRRGMGAVFEAFQESLGRRVALKVLPGSFALEPKRIERFRREARATARIHHPSIVPVYEVGESEGTHYYAMLTGQSPRRLSR